MDFLLVGIDGFFGSVSRYGIYLLENWLGFSRFPFGTLFINIFGCVIAGLLWSFAERNTSSQIMLVLSVGFVGSFTTFSAFSVETLQLVRSENLLFATLNVRSQFVFWNIGGLDRTKFSRLMGQYILNQH